MSAKATKKAKAKKAKTKKAKAKKAKIMRPRAPSTPTEIIPPETAPKKKNTETLSIPEAGEKYFGLSRNASYDAYNRGEIPAVKVGRLLKVPLALMERMMIEKAAATAATKAAAYAAEKAAAA